MNRRDAIQRVALLMGGTIIGAEMFISGCKSTDGKVDDLFDKDHVAFYNEVGETILPATKTPGAKAANVGQFMAVMVRDCYAPEDQKTFLTSMSKINDASDKKFKKKFLEITPQQRTEVLIDLDNEAKAYAKTQKPDQQNHYFRMVKELTLLGFFTSEVGCTQALRYVPVPGKFDGNYPYKKGDKAFALA
ncbi:gluconate 2-dehydrogenase subunit 3 family protein [Mucilaginibacter koreensis]